MSRPVQHAACVAKRCECKCVACAAHRIALRAPLLGILAQYAAGRLGRAS